MKIPAQEADILFDPVALPAILAYRGGSIQATILRVHEEVVGGATSAEDVTRSAFGGMVRPCDYIQTDDVEKMLLR